MFVTAFIDLQVSWWYSVGSEYMASPDLAGTEGLSRDEQRWGMGGRGTEVVVGAMAGVGVGLLGCD